tara:strand:- start:786 stop:1112 length:327 start_codon:yes stop_codon:yes gene_type:complete
MIIGGVMNFKYLLGVFTLTLLIGLILCNAPVYAHDEGNAEKILKQGKILFVSKTNHEHIFTIVFEERIWACSVKTIGNWIGEGVGGAVCTSNGKDAEKFESLEHIPHD